VVVDTAGAPVSDLQVTVRRVATDSILSTASGSSFAAGTYLVLDDGFKDEVAARGEVVRFTGVRGGDQVSADFTFGTDPCRCHIERISGPDTLRLGG